MIIASFGLNAKIVVIEITEKYIVTRNTTRRMIMSNGCNSCEVLYINGVKCHETGCPEAWRDEVRECAWCPQTFTPEHKDQKYCSEDCAEADNT